MKNNQYPKDLILESDMLKYHQHDDSGTRKTEHKTSKHENSNKRTRAERRKRNKQKKNLKQVFHRKVNLGEGTCYFRGNLGHILPDFPKAVSNPKDKWSFKTSTQNLCDESQKSE